MTRLGKSLLVVPALLLALAGCGGTKSTPAVPVDLPVPAPVLLQVTASRPAGTLDSLPDLSWTLTGASGLSLVVRAQGPGASSPGVGFAGVRVASGSIRYLGPDGTWGETEVVYAAIAGAAGTIRPTAPLRLEGEWRFDLLVKDATGALQAMAMAPVVLSSKPALRVTLSQRAALAGDAVEGAVVLARGSADRSVKLLAWWQGPGGEVVQLPEVAPLAFDGPAADLRLPLLARRLDGAAPGSWSLVARLFDAATGEPIAYGEQSLQVCATSSPVAGTLRGSGGSPLGGGASLAEVQALSIDRQVRVSSPVGAAGDFSLALDPGAWAVSALVVDAAGLHRVPVQPLQVGCEAPPLLGLDAAPPVSLPARLAGCDAAARAGTGDASGAAGRPARAGADPLLRLPDYVRRRDHRRQRPGGRDGGGRLEALQRDRSRPLLQHARHPEGRGPAERLAAGGRGGLDAHRQDALQHGGRAHLGRA